MSDIWYLVIFISVVLLLAIGLVLLGRHLGEEEYHDDCDYDYDCCGGGVQEEWR